ncbi:MAG: ABC transporter ATP-binding protein [Gammaproteobacteria bacterium]|nr:ABC transporter ATP-binding protein [Gammaproteobacteria bacterium]
MQDSILAVEDLVTRFYTRDGIVHAVNGVSVDLHAGETLGIVGESGSGKSVLSLSIMGLIPQPPGRIESGVIKFEGQNLLEHSRRQMRALRGNKISMIFQEPMTSLNPVLTCGFQIAEALMIHQELSKKAAGEKAVEMLELVRMPDPRKRASEYPHQLSGGMRQRVMIAMALACNPQILIADEPTTALDVTIQFQILDLMAQLKQQFNTAIIFITHDLGVIAETAERVVVMYAGQKVEEAPVKDLFIQPLHPYTHGLMSAIPKLRLGAELESLDRLQEIPGQVPSLKKGVVGCAFAPRCTFVTDHCRQHVPALEELREGHWVACWEANRTGAEGAN